MEPIDIWRAAQLMVKKHGKEAPAACLVRADEMLERGDPAGEHAWLAVRRAAEALLEDGPPSDISYA
jgi:hypothetical protein